MERIRIRGRRDAAGALVSVTFSNRSSGSFQLPVRGDGDEASATTEQADSAGPQRRQSFAEWAANQNDFPEQRG